MARDVRNLRELMSLARLLRSFAEQQKHDANRELFLTAALALESRARYLAANPDGEIASFEREIALHAPVNQLV